MLPAGRMRPANAFSAVLEGSFNKLTPRDIFSSVLAGIYKAGSPSFCHCLARQIELMP